MLGGIAQGVASKNNHKQGSAQLSSLGANLQSIGRTTSNSRNEEDPEDCLEVTSLSPRIQFNVCICSVIAYRCRSGADLSKCVGTNDLSGIAFKAHGRLTNIHLDSDRVPKSGMMVCRLTGIKRDENGSTACKD